MNRGVVLAGAAAALAAAGVAIWLGTRDSGDAPAPAPAATPVAKPTRTAPPVLSEGSSSPTKVSPADVQNPGSDDAKTYKVDSVTIHDHRGSNAGPPIDLPPNLHPPGSRLIPPTLTGAVAREVRGVLAECSRALPPGARGPHPKMDGEIVIAIKDGKVSVTKALVQLRDTLGDVDSIRQCLEQKSLAVTTDAQGEADLDAYSIHVSFPILGG